MGNDYECVIKKYKERHNREVEFQKKFLNSNDNIEIGYARSIVYGHHDPILYMIKDEKIFGQDYEGIEYVINIFKEYGYDTREYYKDNIHCIDVLKEGDIYAKLTFSDLFNQVSMFNIC